MPTQTYCTRDDVEAAWTPAAVLAAVDDDHNLTLSAAEVAIITRAIERGANRMNATLAMRYPLAALVNNPWCRDCNALLAAYFLATRTGIAAPDPIQEQFDSYLVDLEEIVANRKCVPQVSSTLEQTPTVTNFRVTPALEPESIRRVSETSTGALPPSQVQNHS